MKTKEFILWLVLGGMAFILIAASIATSAYLSDKTRESKERVESNRPLKWWERKRP